MSLLKMVLLQVFLGFLWPTECFLYINSFIESILAVLCLSLDLGYIK